MANDSQLSANTTPSPRAPGSETDQETPARAAVNDQIDKMPGAGAPTEDEAEGESDGTLDETEDKDGDGI